LIHPSLQHHVTTLILLDGRHRALTKIRKGLRQQLLQLIQSHAHPVKPSRLLQVTSDPDDNKFLECADAARADYLITGNQQHFPKFWKQTKVITSREFIDLMAPHLLR
jgi:predicted nucleic acid-binding protein